MNAVILNAGDAAWAFEAIAQGLSRALNVPISETPAQFNYVLSWSEEQPLDGHSFISLDGIRAASDKRTLARIFAAHDVATPQTVLLDSPRKVYDWLREHMGDQWVLKWPIGCGASGHRLQTPDKPIPNDWPQPYVVQKFVRLDVPEVFRLYAVAGETFGWNARRFPPNSKISPFVAHARGARYETVGEVPPEAQKQARRALEATGLLGSFGCADLMCDENGNWLVLEVNTDGIFNHVDRDVDLNDIANEIDARLGRAFHAWIERSQ